MASWTLSGAGTVKASVAADILAKLTFSTTFVKQGANVAKGDDARHLVAAIDHVQIRDIVGVQSIDDLSRPYTLEWSPPGRP